MPLYKLEKAAASRQLRLWPRPRAWWVEPGCAFPPSWMHSTTWTTVRSGPASRAPCRRLQSPRPSPPPHPAPQAPSAPRPSRGPLPLGFCASRRCCPGLLSCPDPRFPARAPRAGSAVLGRGQPPVPPLGAVGLPSLTLLPSDRASSSGMPGVVRGGGALEL